MILYIYIKSNSLNLTHLNGTVVHLYTNFIITSIFSTAECTDKHLG